MVTCSLVILYTLRNVLLYNHIILGTSRPYSRTQEFLAQPLPVSTSLASNWRYTGAEVSILYLGLKWQECTGQQSHTATGESRTSFHLFGSTTNPSVQLYEHHERHSFRVPLFVYCYLSCEKNMPCIIVELGKIMFYTARRYTT